jgi:protein required for attachment to host cells
LKGLLAVEPEEDSPVLSVYLNVDQGLAVNLNRGFEAALKGLLQRTEKKLRSESEKRGFEEDSKRVVSFVSDYQPEAKGIVIFCDASRDFFWHRSLEVVLENGIHWSRRPYIRTLLEARDEFERYGVILADRARARLFKVFLGEIEEIKEALAQADVHRFDASGTDQLRSQMSFQRRADEHARRHLKNVADQMDKLGEKHRFDRLVLAGTQEVVGELKNLLSDRLKKSLVGAIALPIDAGSAEILRETVALQEEYERKGEESLVKNLLTSAAKNQLAVTGLTATLEGILDGRIRQLIYVHGFLEEGAECRQCGSLFDSPLDQCPRCDGGVRRLEDLLEAMVVRVASGGGSVEQVRGTAAEELARKAGGVGAYLRF